MPRKPRAVPLWSGPEVASSECRRVFGDLFLTICDGLMLVAARRARQREATLWGDAHAKIVALAPALNELREMADTSHVLNARIMMVPQGFPRGVARPFYEGLHTLTATQRELETLALTLKNALSQAPSLGRVKDNSTAAVARFFVALEEDEGRRLFTGTKAGLFEVACLGLVVKDSSEWDDVRKRWDEALRQARRTPSRVGDFVAAARKLAAYRE